MFGHGADVVELYPAAVGFDEVVEQITSLTEAVAGAEHCLLLVRDGDTLLPVGRRAAASHLARVVPVALTDPWLARLSDGRPTVLDLGDLAAYRQRRDPRRRAATVALVPLATGGSLEGVAVVAWSAEAGSHARSLSALELLGRWAGRAFHQAKRREPRAFACGERG